VLAGLGDDRGLIAVIAELNDKEPRPNRPEACASCKAPYSQGQIIQDRYYAAHVLRRIGDKRGVPALIEALQDENINYQAAIVLGNLGDERAIPALLDALERARTEPRNPSSMTMDFGLWAGYALLGLRHPTGLLTVVEFLRPEYGEVLRRHAVDALGQFGEKDAVPSLINALQDTDAEVRVNAIMALGRIGDKSVVPALKELLKNSDQAEGRARLRYEPPTPLFKLAIFAHPLEKVKVYGLCIVRRGETRPVCRHGGAIPSPLRISIQPLVIDSSAFLMSPCSK
jgi:HEAT repeat protein